MGSMDNSQWCLGWVLVGLCRAVGCVGLGWGCWAGLCRAVLPAALPAVLPALGSNWRGRTAAQELAATLDVVWLC